MGTAGGRPTFRKKLYLMLVSEEIGCPARCAGNLVRNRGRQNLGPEGTYPNFPDPRNRGTSRLSPHLSPHLSGHPVATFPVPIFPYFVPIFPNEKALVPILVGRIHSCDSLSLELTNQCFTFCHLLFGQRQCVEALRHILHILNQFVSLKRIYISVGDHVQR
jgi:hypothetical protein